MAIRKTMKKKGGFSDVKSAPLKRRNKTFCEEKFRHFRSKVYLENRYKEREFSNKNCMEFSDPETHPTLYLNVKINEAIKITRVCNFL